MSGLSHDSVPSKTSGSVADTNVWSSEILLLTLWQFIMAILKLSLRTVRFLEFVCNVGDDVACGGPTG